MHAYGQKKELAERLLSFSLYKHIGFRWILLSGKAINTILPLKPLKEKE